MASWGYILSQAGLFMNDISSRQSNTLPSDLPEDVLVLILQQVDQQDRLRACASVSTRFKAAAQAASCCVQMQPQQPQLEGALSWLHAHGSTVTSLDFTSPPGSSMALSFQHLPCSSLQQLKMTNAQVKLSAPPSTAQHTCRGMTSLSLSNCAVIDTSEQLAGLSALRGLQDLSITRNATAPAFTQGTAPAAVVLPGDLLSQLLQLSRMTLSGSASCAGLNHLSCLTDMQHLELTLHGSTQAEEFAGVQQLQCLTFLQLHCRGARQLAISSLATPGFKHLTALQELHLHSLCSFHPAVLTAMSHLNHLELQSVQLTDQAAGTSALLAALQDLRRITALKLEGTLQHSAPDVLQYTAFGALPRLHWLQLQKCVLPADIWQQLVTSAIYSCRHLSVGYMNLDYISRASQMDESGLSSFVFCFPNLGNLYCRSAFKPGIDLAPLRQLSFLTALVIDNIRDEDVSVLSMLQGLSHLYISQPGTITDLGLLQLTALTRLTCLYITGNLSADVTDYGYEAITLINLAPVLAPPAYQPPDVWQQLLKRCMRSDDCQPVILTELMDQRITLINRAQEVAWLQREVAIRDAQVAQVQKHAIWQQKCADTKHWELVARESLVSSMTQSLEARQHTLDAKDAQINQHAKHLADREATAAAREASLAAASKEAEACHWAAVAREQQVQEAAQQVMARSAQLDAREQQLRQLQALLVAGVTAGQLEVVGQALRQLQI